MNPRPLESETGEFIFSPYGSIHALHVRGNEAFLERSYNLINSFSDKQIARRRGHMSEYYILTKEDFLDRVTLYYRCQLRSRDYSSEDDAMAVARQRAEVFWANKVQETTLSRPPCDIPYIYGYGRPGNKVLTEPEIAVLDIESAIPAVEFSIEENINPASAHE